MPNVHNRNKLAPTAITKTDIEFLRLQVNPIMENLHLIAEPDLRDRIALMCGLALGYAMRAQQCEKEQKRGNASIVSS